jgi:Spy/CpxP family protein refolding chaperone
MIRKLMIAFATVAAAAAFAQTTPHGPASQPAPEERIANRVEYLTALLSLQPSQVTQITTIFTDEYRDASALETSMQSAKQAVQDAVEALAADSTIDKVTAAAAQVEGQMNAVRAKARVKFLTVLTGDQRAKLAKFNGRGPGNDRGDRPGAPGPRGQGQPRQ